MKKTQNSSSKLIRIFRGYSSAINKTSGGTLFLNSFLAKTQIRAIMGNMEKSVFTSMDRNSNDWWLTTKTEIICELLGNLQVSTNSKILDIGSGTGYVAAMLQNKGYRNITVSDGLAESLKILKSKNFQNIKRIVLPEINLRDKYDVVLLLDVLEHVKADDASLENIYKILSKSGICIVTVPAFMFLWSKKDEDVHHFRRYRKNQLMDLAEKAGFRIRYISYYNFLLFLPALIFSKINKTKNKVPRYGRLQNLLFKPIFMLEKVIVSNKINLFPFGVSIIAILEKE